MSAVIELRTRVSRDISRVLKTRKLLLNRQRPGVRQGPGRQGDPYPCCSAENRAMRTYDFTPLPRYESELDDLLHPAQAFERPMKVVEDPDLTLAEKRAILASWASDACALEAAPALRRPPGTGRPAQLDDVMDALRSLDRLAGSEHKPRPHYRRVLEERRPGVFGRKSEEPPTRDRGATLI
jgi:hypothetical protein